MSEEKVPVIGGAVLVTFYSDTLKLSTLVAHVLAITGSAAGLATADGQPALTVAYPDPNADPAILSSPNWQKAYIRKTGVVHFSHQSAVDGQESIVWGYPVGVNDLPTLIKPEGAATNPIFERPVDAEVPEVPLGQAGAVTLRSESEPIMPADPTSAESVAAAQKADEERQAAATTETAETTASATGGETATGATETTGEATGGAIS